MKKGSKKCMHCSKYTMDVVEWVNEGEGQWVCKGCCKAIFPEDEDNYKEQGN